CRFLQSSSCLLCLVFFNAAPTAEIYTLSLHDALPILVGQVGADGVLLVGVQPGDVPEHVAAAEQLGEAREAGPRRGRGRCVLHRSEEHTSELQSRENLVCRLLLEKKKRKK